jgi:multiple sugar transport system substrate-binding protein
MIELRGITWDHPRGYQPLAASVEPYADRSGVCVTWEKHSLKAFGDTPVDELAVQYDLLIIDHPHVGLAAATNALLPLDTCIAPDILATLASESAGPSHASYTYAGHQWALAMDAAMQTCAYCHDLLDEPLPQTWDEVIALGKRLQDGGRMMACTLVPTDCACCFLTLCASLGDPPGHGDSLVSERVGRQALELIVEFHRVSHPDSLTWNPIRMLDHMSSENDVAYCPLTFCYTNYSRDSYAPHLVRFANIPGVKGSILGGTGYAVSARCQNPEAACAYGVWLCRADTQRTFYVENGGQPSNIVAWKDQQANQLTNHFLRDTLDTLQQSYLRPRHHGFVDFQVELGEIIHAMLRDGTDSGECLHRLSQLYVSTKMV